MSAKKIFGWIFIVNGILLFLLLLEVFLVLYLDELNWAIFLRKMSLLEVTITTFSEGGLKFPLMICLMELIMFFQLFIGYHLVRKVPDNFI